MDFQDLLSFLMKEKMPCLRALERTKQEDAKPTVCESIQSETHHWFGFFDDFVFCFFPNGLLQFSSFSFFSSQALEENMGKEVTNKNVA